MTELRTALQWRARYESGETVEQISLDVGTYPGKVRNALHSVNTPMRPAHARTGTVKSLAGNVTDGIRGANVPPIRRFKLGGSSFNIGHRRKGGRI